MTRLPSISLSEFAARIAAHRELNSGGGGISALVANGPDVVSVAHALKEDLEFVAQCPTFVVVMDSDLADMLGVIAEAQDSMVILHGFTQLGAAGWARMDEQRNRIESVMGLIFLLAPDDLAHLQRHAPNLSSWLGGRVWSLADAPAHLSPVEIQDRLATLRGAFGRTDDQVLALARANDLPPEPEYAEWLILLGHGGLLP